MPLSLVRPANLSQTETRWNTPPPPRHGQDTDTTHYSSTACDRSHAGFQNL